MQMPAETPLYGHDDALDAVLDEVRAVVQESVAESSLCGLVGESDPVVGGGKMLRAKMGLSIGAVSGVPHDILVRAMAAIEMIHAASLLHDDVIDGAALRRGAPAFWVRKGVSGAILLGDLLVCRAVTMVTDLPDPRLAPVFVRKITEMCDAEAEQELVLRDTPPSWEQCVDIARRKTGSLFAFVGYAAGGDDEARCEMLAESAYLLGTAYQLGDDILDAFGDPEQADKSIGSDAAHAKVAAGAVHFDTARAPVDYINALCRKAENQLHPWPDVQDAWRVYTEAEFRPVLDEFLESFLSRCAD